MRELEEWIGEHDDQRIPDRVRLRVFERHGGRCPKCTRPLHPSRWACDHIVALANGGEHRESNLQPLCSSPCHSSKTALDVALKSRAASIRKHRAGIRPPSRFACAKSSPFKRKIGGQVVRRQ
jgi:5-methylcytosine-specific restriction endonuclease McrA